MSKRKFYIFFITLIVALFAPVFALEKTVRLTPESFKHPPNNFRIVQYQLTRGALKTYPQKGIGGYMAFFYKNLYLSGSKGLKSIGPLVDAANKSGAKAWLADDWGYPSGMAGGRVVEQNPEYELRSLVMLKQTGSGKKAISFDLPKGLESIVCSVLYPIVMKNGVEGLDYKNAEIVGHKGRKVTSSGIAGKWQLSVFAKYLRNKNTQAQSTMKQFKHAGKYPDLMNAKAVASFIKNMHEPIIKQIKSPNKTVEGFYCNEPNLMQTCWDKNGPYAPAPWTDSLSKIFKIMHGYDLRPYLAACFSGNDINSRRVRLHYRQTVSQLFAKNFAGQIRNWCNKRGIKSSGHFLLNQYLSMHVQGYGDMMKFISEFDIPALDIPIPNPNQFMNFNYQQTRFFSSVTSWKKRGTTLMLLDPIIGGYGMNRLTPGLPLLINSVNMASLHGVSIFSSYMTGHNKADYSFLNEYIGRLSQVLRGANRDAGVALYYPISNFQADLIPSNQRWPQIVGKNSKRQSFWDQTEKTLLNADIEYMVVHPEGIEQSTIKSSKMTIGHGRYHTIVIPQLDFISLAVLKKLYTFKKAGGKILWLGKLPGNAEKSINDPIIVKVMKGEAVSSLAELPKKIAQSHLKHFDLQFTPGTDKLMIGRFIRDRSPVYLLVNRLQKEITVKVTGQRVGAGSSQIQLLDPSTGQITNIKLPMDLKIKANRALMLMPGRTYLSKKLSGK